jgi:methylthioribose-1-phosphate isomerase
LKTSSNIEQSNQSKSFANACAEQALQQLRINPSYTGNGSIVFGQGSCVYTVSNAGQIIIQSQGTAAAVARKVKITVDSVSPSIHVSSWQEVADF